MWPLLLIHITLFDRKKKEYWSERISTDGGSSLTTLLKRNKRTSSMITPTSNDADTFLQFFDDKVKTVRAATDDRQLPTFSSTTGASLSELSPCTKDEVRKLISQSPTKSCGLDPIPTFLLKELVDVLLPYLTGMVNASLREGRLPSSQKHAVVTPLLKKFGLDPDELKNYRPVSNLTFVSKLVERTVAARLVTYFDAA